MKTIINYSLRYFSTNPSIGSTFAKRAAGQSKLKQFFKYTHPDLFGGAPDKVKETNLRSVQELNEYLTSVGNPLSNNGVEGKQL